MATTDKKPDQDAIEAERRRLQKAADFALASVELEGFKPSQEAQKEVARRIADRLKAFEGN